MTQNSISLLSGLPLTSHTTNENGFLKYFEGTTTWASNINFNADPDRSPLQPTESEDFFFFFRKNRWENQWDPVAGSFSRENVGKVLGKMQYPEGSDPNRTSFT